MSMDALVHRYNIFHMDTSSIANVAEWIAFLFYSQVSHPNVGSETLHPSWREWSSGIRQSVDMYVGTDVLEELAACIFRVVHVAILGGSNLPQNVTSPSVCVVSEDWNLHQYCCENLKSQTC
jgi:hypothetical protein